MKAWLGLRMWGGVEDVTDGCAPPGSSPGPDSETPQRDGRDAAWQKREDRRMGGVDMFCSAGADNNVSRWVREGGYWSDMWVEST